MPNRKEHVLVGGIAGAACAAVHASDGLFLDQVLEVIGGFLGGRVGGCLPDVFEPATTPRHRGAAHSLCAGTGIFVWTAKKLASCQRFLRDKADEIAAKRQQCEKGSTACFLLGVQEKLCRLLAGFLAGLLLGYISHIVLDGATPAGICFI